MATWLAALIVTGVLGAVAGTLAVAGRKQIQAAAPPVRRAAFD